MSSDTLFTYEGRARVYATALAQVAAARTVVLFRFFDHGRLFSEFQDEAAMATAYAAYAQLCGYGLEMETR